MKTLLTLFILLFSSPVFAEDISDFEIEGMSIGDSLLDYMSEEEIKKELEINNSRYEFLNNYKFGEVYNFEKFQNYDYISFFVKPDDNKYIIYAIYGATNYQRKIKQCYLKQKEIFNQISLIFKNITPEKGTEQHTRYPTGDNTVRHFTFNLDEGHIRIECYNFEENLLDYEHESLLISINRYEVFNWLGGF